MPDTFTVLSFAGTGVFAISGALMGLRQRMDVIGIIFLAGVTGIGGGTLRDVLLGRVPVGWVEKPAILGTCAACAVLVALLNPILNGRRLAWLLYADAAGLALFAVLGTSTALDAGAHPVVAVLFGAMSASFGGVIRDVICNEKPILFSDEIYITAALAAGAVFVLLPEAVPLAWRSWCAMAVGLGLRLAAIGLGWRWPFPRYP
ncbi:MAG: trimeric intracellular cation channel family protein [Alphaproteobacteria bacterium]